MKKLAFIIMIAGITAFSSCATYSNGRGNNGMPPGKAKKIFGTKSAKPFAPGQQKRKGGQHRQHSVFHYQSGQR
ncbi:hypothetical protein [Parapedobacter lycopersici]|uniref:hypothetical protein n=1 Tax=Parapedobacter lycopersici TaxID=1864939 RepID=UPI003340E775